MMAKVTMVIAAVAAMTTGYFLTPASTCSKYKCSMPAAVTRGCCECCDAGCFCCDTSDCTCATCQCVCGGCSTVAATAASTPSAKRDCKTACCSATKSDQAPKAACCDCCVEGCACCAGGVCGCAACCCDMDCCTVEAVKAKTSRCCSSSDKK